MDEYQRCFGLQNLAKLLNEYWGIDWSHLGVVNEKGVGGVGEVK